MLRIHTVTSATDAKKYYAASDYYAEGAELIGRWGGKLAGTLGLSGTVGRSEFELLCDNLHPKTGKQLTPRTREQRRVAYDFVFSGPKSFSIVEALAPETLRRQLWDAFDQAITETMEREIEPDMQTRVRLDGSQADRTTGNLVWASFDHSTSRPVSGLPPDMHRHRHVLAFNVTYDAEEDRIKAGQFAAIKRDGEYFTAAFYARLASKLEAMGFAIDRQGGKRWEIAGVPASVIEAFSKRTGEVEEAARQRGVTQPAYKAELGAKTRARKDGELSPDQLRLAWDAQLSPQERSALEAVYRRAIPRGRVITASEAVAFATLHCFERESVVPERELKRVALLHGLGDVTGAEIDAELPRHGVIARTLDGRKMATTREVLEEERFITGFAGAGLGTVRPVGVPDSLARGSLNDGQWQALLALLRSSDRVGILEGPAGAGKSTLLQAYDAAAQAQGQKITYLASTTSAVEVLRKDGFSAETVAHFLTSEKLQDAAKGGRVVVDEASMLGHRDAYRLFQAANAKNLRLTLLGDAMQHGSVARGALLRVLKDYGGLKPVRLTQIRRQQSKLYREAVQKLAEGEAVAGFDQLDRIGWVKENREGDRYWHIGAEYLQALEEKKSVLVVSPTHAEGERITAEIRRQLRLAGRLDKAEREFTRLVALNATEAERGLATTYRADVPLVIQFHQNAKGGIKKGDRVAVADPGAVPLSEAAKFQLYAQQSLRLAAGDLLRFTANVKSLDGKHKISNGSAYRVAGFDPFGNIRLENGWMVAADAGHFRHGYTETSFGAQGKTVDRVILGMASGSLPAVNREQMYVSASRARERLSLYTDDKAGIRAAIAESSAKRAASDLVPQGARQERLRLQAERLRRHRWLARMRAAWEGVIRQHERGRKVAHGR